MRAVGVKQITDGINPWDRDTQGEGLTNDFAEIVATTSRSDGGGETNGLVSGVLQHKRFRYVCCAHSVI